jgi:hypothetical protein
LKFIISLKNIGGRSAKAFYVEIYNIPSELKGSSTPLYRGLIFNPIAAGEIISFRDIKKYTGDDLPSRYVSIVFKYRDSLTRKFYLQKLVYKWLGARPALMPINNEEAGKVLTFLEKGTDQDAFKEYKLIDE